MSKVCAVILTYNRVELLRECLEAIAAQTRPCDRILIINNASTDGTLEMLTKEWGGRVDITSLPGNIGAAGGFNIGMRTAYRYGADFIWVMDDDVIPEADALERLLHADNLLESRNQSAPFLISVARAPTGALTNVPAIDTRHNELAYENWPNLLEHQMVPIRRATFVSILLPREILQQYGLPISSMFIWGEDTEYTIRITAEHPGYLVGDSKVVHARQVAGMLDIRKETTQTRISYHFCYIRNRLYTFKKHRGRRAALSYTFGLVPLIVGLCASGQFTKARTVLSGIWAGWRFDPAIEAADAPFDQNGILLFESADNGIIPHYKLGGESPGFS